jgi:hypothetical protein
MLAAESSWKESMTKKMENLCVHKLAIHKKVIFLPQIIVLDQSIIGRSVPEPHPSMARI